MISYCCNSLILQPEQPGGVGSIPGRLRRIATNDPRNVVESGILQTCISDHCVVYVVRKYFGSQKPQHKRIATRQMKNFDGELFLIDLASVDWQAL